MSMEEKRTYFIPTIPAVTAPGYQGQILPRPLASRVRWRTVRRDGTRLPAVGELGVVVAQVRALLRADGIAWVVGSDEHTVEIQISTADDGQYEVQGIGPRWTQTLLAALRR